MDENKKKNKPFRGLSGSLAARILLIALLLLVVPLLILSGFLYYDEVQLKRKDNRFTLNVLMNRSEKLIAHTIEEEKEILNAIDLLFNPQTDGANTLAELARRDHVSALFHLTWESGGYKCDYASEQNLVGNDFTALANQAIRGTALIAAPEHSTFFLIEPSREGRQAWGVILSTKGLIDKLGLAENILYPTATTVLIRPGQVVFSTASNLQHQVVSHEGAEETFHFQLDDGGYLGVEREIPNTNFSLLISMPEKIHFVDIPHFLPKLLGLLGLILVVGGGGTLFLTFRLSTPMKRFSRVMQEVGEGNLSSRFHKDIMGFEINVLGEIFNEMVDSLIQHMEEIEHERIGKETLAKELMIGQEVQNSILPKELPAFRGLDIAARFVSAKEVGGDFYDFLVKDNRLMISIADTSGKGISACLYSLSVRSMLRSYGEIHSNLQEIVQETNNLFCHDTGDSGVFVTAWVAFFDEKTKELSYSNCGHYPALLQKKDGTLQKLSTAGMALGVLPFDHVAIEKVSLETGDTLLLFTDGVVEAHNDKMEMFGEDRLIQVLDVKKGLEAQKIVDDMIEEVALFAEGAPQHDDLTIVVLNVQ